MTTPLEQVRVERDDGHRNRWGFGRWFYRKEGQKLSISTKRMGLALTALILVMSVTVIVRGPTEPIPRSGTPISLRSDAVIVSDTDVQSIPPVTADSYTDSARTRGRRITKPKFTGVEHIARPRLTSIPPGLIASAVLIRGATDGVVFAELQDDLEFNGEILLPKKTLLIGTGSSGDERLSVTFSKIRFEDGKTQAVSAEALDGSDQTPGIKGSKVSKYVAMMAAAGALSFAGGLAEGLQESENQGGTSVRKSDLRNAALNGAAHAALDTSQEVINKWKDKKTVIQVKAGTKIQVSFSGE
jgi:hypothetical protein